MKARTFYKVVRSVEGKLYSCAVRCPSWRHVYSTSRWAKSDMGLFVFKTLKDAVAFCGHEGMGVSNIWECQGEDRIRVRPVILCHITEKTPKDLRTFWTKLPGVGALRNNFHKRLRITPDGTAMFRRVKLLRPADSDRAAALLAETGYAKDRAASGPYWPY